MNKKFFACINKSKSEPFLNKSFSNKSICFNPRIKLFLLSKTGRILNINVEKIGRTRKKSTILLTYSCILFIKKLSKNPETPEKKYK